MAQAIPKNPYKVVPIPAGYRRALPKEISPKVQRAAVRALQQCLPLGKMQATEVDGKLFMFITEGHYDDHVTKPGKPVWHPGISTVVPINQPVKVASQNLRDAQFINMSRMTGENDSSFEGEGFWSRFKKWLTEPSPTATKKLTVPQKQAQDAAAAALVLSQMRGDGFYGRRPKKRSLAELKAILAARRAKMGLEEIDDPNFRADVGSEEDLESIYAADECYDAVNGEDFEFGDVGTDFGDDFGKFNFKKGLKKFAKGSLAVSTGGLSLAASKKGRKIVKKVATKKGLAAIATGGLSVAAQKKNRALSAAVLTGGLSLAARKQRQAAAARLAAAKKRPAARPAVRPVARPIAARPAASRPAASRPAAARSAATAPRTTPTKTDSPLGPSAPFDETMTMGPIEQEMPEQEVFEQEAIEEEGPSEEVEAAMDSYEDEEGDEDSESEDPDESAINGEGNTHSKYSIGA